MTHSFTCLLTLLFFLSSPAMKGNVEIWQSPLAAERRTTSVFWSGYGSQSAAETWAASNGGQTLSTSAFAVGENATQAEVENASISFAKNASGNVQVFQPAAGVPVNGIWAQSEYSALMQNPNVSSITYQIIDDSGSITHTISIPK
jgi:hypothetical protein